MSSPVRPLLLASLALTLGCGPNYRYVYDGESAFERCYGLDYDTTVNDVARSSCWSTWLQSYSYGANPDRIDFARNRLGTVGAGERRTAPPATAGTLPTQSTSPAVPTPLTAGTTAPLTVDVDRALPAAVAPESAPPSPWNGRVSTGGNPVSAPPPTQRDSTGAEPPGASCGHECRGSWSACGGRCPRQDAACVARCDEGYRECMRGCF
jgi:hypothetical protein